MPGTGRGPPGATTTISPTTRAPGSRGLGRYPTTFGAPSEDDGHAGELIGQFRDRRRRSEKTCLLRHRRRWPCQQEHQPWHAETSVALPPCSRRSPRVSAIRRTWCRTSCHTPPRVVVRTAGSIIRAQRRVPSPRGWVLHRAENAWWRVAEDDDAWRDYSTGNYSPWHSAVCRPRR